jgi:hypothetical protein
VNDHVPLANVATNAGRTRLVVLMCPTTTHVVAVGHEVAADTES